MTAILLAASKRFDRLYAVFDIARQEPTKDPKVADIFD